MSKANNRAAADTFWLSLLAFRIKVIKDIYSRFSSALPAPVPLYLLRVVLNL